MVLETLGVFTVALIIDIYYFFIIISFGALGIMLFASSINCRICNTTSSSDRPRFLCGCCCSSNSSGGVRTCRGSNCRLSGCSVHSRIPASISVAMGIMSRVFLVVVLVTFVCGSV